MPPKRTHEQVKETTTTVENENKISRIVKIYFNNDELNHYLSMTKPWELSVEIDKEALRKAFPDLEKRLNFIDELKRYNHAKLEEFDMIESKLPKRKSNPFFYRINTWKKNILKGPKVGVNIAIKNLSDFVEEFEEEFEEETENGAVNE